MDERDHVFTKRDNRLIQQVVETILQAEVAHRLHNGQLSLDDLNNPNKILEIARELTSGKFEFALTADHTSDLIKEANKHLEVSNFEVYFMFVATFFEHSINYIIKIACERKTLPHPVVKEILKSSSIESKYTWLLALLKAPTFNKAHYLVVRRIADKRNAFVHYKWHAEPDTPEYYAKERKETEELVKDSKLAIKYMKRYISLFLHSGQTQKIKKVVKLRQSSRRS